MKREERPTVLCRRCDDNIALDNNALQGRPPHTQQGAQRERANPRRPKALERRGVLRPRIKQHIQAQTALLANARRLEQIQHGIAMVINQKRERDDQALQERRRLRRLHAHEHRLQQVRQNGQHALARAPEEVDDEVPDHEPAGLVAALQQAGDDGKNVYETRLAVRVCP